MRKIKEIAFLFILLLAVGSFYPKQANAQMGSGMMQGTTQKTQTTQNETLKTTLNSLLQKYKAASVKNINCSKVTNEDFEKFGDVVMGAMAGSEQSHSSMEKMMGGEGSRSLKSAHIKMGQQYLGCVNGERGGVVNMMGYGGGMMGEWSVFGGLTWVLLVVFLILGSVYFWKEITKNGKK